MRAGELPVFKKLDFTLVVAQPNKSPVQIFGVVLDPGYPSVPSDERPRMNL